MVDLSEPRRRGALRGAAGLAVLFAVAEAISRLELVDSTYLPPASLILVTVGRLAVDPTFLMHVGATLASAAFGLAVAAIVAIPVGIVLGSVPATYRASVAAIEFLRPIPSVALIPLAILLLGRGLDMRVLIVAYASAWPILLNAIYGARAVDPLARDTARVFGLRRGAILRRVVLPASAPFAFTGVRIASGIALIVAVSAELIGGGRLGIGTWMLATSQAGVPRELLYAAIVMSGLLGLAVHVALAGGERRLFGWHQRARPTA